MNQPMPGIPSVQTTGTTDAIRRLRLVEESVSNLRRKTTLDEENGLREFKHIRSEIDRIDEQVKDLKRTMIMMREDISKIIKELQNSAKKEEFLTLQKYVDIWKPIQFVTQEEVDSIVRRSVEQAFSELGHELHQKSDIISEQKQTEHFAHMQKTSAEIPPERKKQIAQFIEEHEDVKQLLINKPDELMDHIQNDEFLSKLFAGVNVIELSKKIRSMQQTESTEEN